MGTDVKVSAQWHLTSLHTKEYLKIKGQHLKIQGKQNLGYSSPATLISVQGQKTKFVISLYITPILQLLNLSCEYMLYFCRPCYAHYTARLSQQTTCCIHTSYLGECTSAGRNTSKLPGRVFIWSLWRRHLEKFFDLVLTKSLDAQLEIGVRYYKIVVLMFLPAYLFTKK